MTPGSAAPAREHVFSVDANAYAHADPEFYAPLAGVADAGRMFAPSAVPADWSSAPHDVWTAWSPSDVVRADEGWKVHVSARVDRAHEVLDTVAQACFAESVPFKHIRAELFFLALHHKHGPRQQAGKFCAAYPPDEPTARRLMDRLAAVLSNEEGPYVLTDRRYRDSRTVHYRWGAFTPRGRRRPDGRREWLVRDGFGHDVVDVRGPSFVLPDGIGDPFTPEAASSHRGPIVVGGYEIVRAIALSNAGGTYEARELQTGDRVFVKEARAHNGLTWDRCTAHERLRREHAVLVALHDADPGVCPQPREYFTEWEHEFLVTEFIEGTPLNRWTAQRSPVLQAGRVAADFAAYYADCKRIMADLDRALGRIHDVGYRFGDVSPANILVAPEGGARLVDFETASRRDEPPIAMGTDGYMPLGGSDADGPYARDDYGSDAVALALLLPLHNVMRHSPSNMPLLRRDLELHAPVPAWLWRRALRCTGDGKVAAEGRLPTPADLDSRPRQSLEQFAEEVRRGLLAMADPDHSSRMVPTVPRAFETNMTCVAYGTAGLVHALHVTGSDVPQAIMARFRRDALAERGELPPGLHVGAAGVAWVLAERGCLDEAMELLGDADRHPILLQSTTLGEGVAGVGLTHLAMYRHNGDDRSLRRAAAAGDVILGTPDLISTLGPHDAVGLLHGRAGLALFLYYLARDTGEEKYVDAGRRLLHEELDRAISLTDGALSFADNAVARRAMPYLYAGSAGVALALTRFAAAAPDERFAAALPRIIDDASKRCTMLPGLYCGLAGIAFVAAEHADWSGDAARHDDAIALATGLVKHAIPHASGVRFLGDGLLRYSAELWSGGAGVLLALHRVLHGAADQFFTLDGVQRPIISPAPTAAATRHHTTLRT
jgi:tRNA A-37 threonylcarbamoyl transferase component Bud32